MNPLPVCPPQASIAYAVAQHAAITITDPEGRITYVSEKFSAFSGYNQQELLGQTHRVVNSGYHPASFFAHLHQRVTSGNPWRGEICNRAKNGTYFWVDMTITPILVGGSVAQLIAISTEISAFKQAQEKIEQLLQDARDANEELQASAEELRQTLEYSLETSDRIAESEARYRLISESMQDLICLHDLAGRFSYVSPSVSTLLGYSPEELLGQSPEQLLSPPQWARLTLRVNSWMHRGEAPRQLLYPIRAKNGAWHWLETLLQPILDEKGQVVSLHSASRDVTQRKAAEESLQRTLKELRQRNLELDHYAYRVSHDLRAPLCSIKGLAHLIAQETDLGLIKQLNARVEDQVGKSDEFISSVLAHTRTLSAPEQRIRLDLPALIEQCWQELEYLPDWNRIRLQITGESEEVFYGDAFRLALVLRNFVSNAIKYANPARADQYVRFFLQVDPFQVRIKIEDNGIGIAQESIPRLGEMFFRGTEKSTGNGLGLYIVKQALNQLGGQLSVESQLGQGTTFLVQLPNALPAPA